MHLSSSSSGQFMLKSYQAFSSDTDSTDTFFELIKDFGMKKLLKVPQNVVDNEILVKKLIKLDTCALYYLPEHYHQDKYFKEVEKNHEILLKSPINKKLSSTTLNWIVDNCPDYVYFEYLKKPFPQLPQCSALLKEKIAIGFLITGQKVPKYLETDAARYKDLRVDELILIKKSIMSYELIEASLDSKPQRDIKIKI